MESEKNITNSWNIYLNCFDKRKIIAKHVGKLFSYVGKINLTFIFTDGIMLKSTQSQINLILKSK
jgi:hypothetical protein